MGLQEPGKYLGIVIGVDKRPVRGQNRDRLKRGALCPGGYRAHVMDWECPEIRRRAHWVVLRQPCSGAQAGQRPKNNAQNNTQNNAQDNAPRNQWDLRKFSSHRSDLAEREKRGLGSSPWSNTHPDNADVMASVRPALIHPRSWIFSKKTANFFSDFHGLNPKNTIPDLCFGQLFFSKKIIGTCTSKKFHFLR